MIGNITRDPDFKTLPSGQSVCKLSIASNRTIKPKNSQNKVQEVCFIDVNVWGSQAETCNKFLEKGSSILVEGRIKQENWTTPDGQSRSKHVIVADKVVFLKSGSQSGASGSYDSDLSGGEVRMESKGFEDDLPF